MANRKQVPDGMEGDAAPAAEGYRGGARYQTDATGVRQGGNGQPAAGEKDARGLTIDSTLPEPEAPVPGDAAKGPWAVDTTPKGD